MKISISIAFVLVVGLTAAALPHALAQAIDTAAAQAQAKPAAEAELVLLDTDIGDDIDDAFALSLALRSPEIHLLGVSTAFGDTELRARLLDRYLGAVGRNTLPVSAGGTTPANNVFTQSAYAHHAPERKHADGVAFLLNQIRTNPGQITLIAIGPLFNVKAAIEKDPATFKKLKRVVIMGGSIDRGYDSGTDSKRPPDAEWNIQCDPAGLRALLASGVPVYIMPLDSTQVRLSQHDLEKVLAHGSPVTDQLALLYHQWVWGNGVQWTTPTLFDPVAVAYSIRPDLCPTTPLRIEVDDKGFTRRVDGPPNAQVCLKSDEDGFRQLLLDRLAGEEGR
jgi:inosine-uridine nucleoside N-ribohydrolase